MKKLVTVFLSVCSLAGFSQADIPAYFQQDVAYTIQVKLDDTKHMLNGSESFTYKNNSPYELKEIYMHIWPNAYKNSKTALARQLARMKNFVLFTTLEENKGYIDSLDFSVNGQKVKWTYHPEHIDICIINLPTPLKPGQTCTIATPFRVKLPSGSISRLGHVGQSYQITQWYPKPAVFDRTGWHAMPYLTQGEFYSEYGSYDVSITLPKNYILGATGDCQTPSEVAFMNEQAAQSELKLKQGMNNDFPASSSEWKTVRYTQNNVHDFGWFADKRWIVTKGEVTTPKEGRKVTTWALFTPLGADVWVKGNEYLHDAIYYYSLWNGDYPYNQVTAVDGTISAGGGMEYPNVTVIGTSNTPRMLETVIMHEVGHNWFYGILGSNERDNAWMDEGLNSFNEDRYMDTKYPNAKLGAAIGAEALDQRFRTKDFSQRSLSELSYFLSAATNVDQPLQLNSDNFTGLNYGGIVYKKTAILFYYLKGYLGEALFDECMHTYYNEWKFKHPSPEDIENVFERVSKQNLDWFFHDLIRTTKKIDFEIARVKKSGTGYQVKVKNVGQAEGGFSLGQEDGKSQWYSPIQQGKSTWVQYENLEGNAIRIDAEGVIPEMNRGNNFIRKQGLFKKVEPIKMEFAIGIKNPKFSQVYYSPLLAWNANDGVMLGLNLHNRHIIRQNWEYSIAPLYSFSRNTFNGFASAYYHQRNLSAGVRVQRFGNAKYEFDTSSEYEQYLIANPNVSYTFRNKPENLNKKFVMTLNLGYHFQYFANVMTNDLVDAEFRSHSTKEFVELRGGLSQKLGFRSNFNASGRILYGTNYVWKGSQDIGTILSASGSYSYQYSLKSNKTVSVGAYIGYQANDNALGVFNQGAFGLSGVGSSFDYTYDQLFFGRNSSGGLWGAQNVDGMGSLGINLNGLGATKRLVRGQVQFEVPKLPITLKATVLDAWSPECPQRHAEGIYWNTAAQINFGGGIASVTLPIFGNQNVKDAASAGYFRGVLFTLNLSAMDPFKIIRSIQLN